MSTLTDAKKLIATVERIGVKLPKPFLDACQHADRMIDRTRRPVSAPGGLATAVIAALARDADPAADPDVQRLLAARQLTTTDLVANLGAAINNELRTTLTGHVDAVLATWHKPFATAAQALAVARERIGDVPLEDAEPILRRGGDIAAVWAAAKANVDTIDTIDRAWAILAGFTGFAPSDETMGGTNMGAGKARRFRLLRIADPTGHDWAEAGLEGNRTATAWDALLAGFTLSLADGATYQRRLHEVTTYVPEPDTPIAA